MSTSPSALHLYLSFELAITFMNIALADKYVSYLLSLKYFANSIETLDTTLEELVLEPRLNHEARESNTLVFEVMPSI